MDTSVNLARDASPPEAEPRSVIRLGLIGLGITGTAAAVGLVLDGSVDAASRVRNVLTPVGILVAGCAVSMRPGLIAAWLIAALTCLLGWAGFAPSWDSAQMVCRVFAVLALLGALLLWLPPVWRVVLASVMILFHFGGILSAVTSPPPQPFLTGQAWTRIYRPYLQFTYMNNAYQFYSPDPGPASEMWVCIEYAAKEAPPPGPDGKTQLPETLKGWLKVPRRSTDFRDPLGQTFYRRLALTEQLVSPGLTYSASAREQEEIAFRRQRHTDIPLRADVMAVNLQHRPPSDGVRRIVMPAYVQYLGRAYNNREGYDIKSIKVYRVQHRIISADEFAAPRGPKRSPYDPTTYFAFYHGTFDKDGNLIDPRDPMLYWLVPILNKPGVQQMTGRIYEFSDEDYRRYFDDYITKHAGSDHRKDLLP